MVNQFWGNMAQPGLPPAGSVKSRLTTRQIQMSCLGWTRRHMGLVTVDILV
jgi:hypothetical protein